MKEQLWCIACAEGVHVQCLGNGCQCAHLVRVKVDDNGAEPLPPAPASAQGAAPTYQLVIPRPDLDVVLAFALTFGPDNVEDAAIRVRLAVDGGVEAVVESAAQGPPEGTASAEPVVPASKLRALSEQWEQESDRVTLRHSSPRSAMRRCAEDLNRLLAGG